MDALVELVELVGRNVISAHQDRLAVATVTSTGDIGLVHIGMRVIRGFHVMTAVATDTGRGVFVPLFIEGLAMKAGLIKG
jgi:CheY-like chemotaxis protein